MPERPPTKPKSPEDERDEFIRSEIASFREMLLEAMRERDSTLPASHAATQRERKDLEGADEKQLFSRMCNNLHAWLPQTEHKSSVGMYRAPEYGKLKKKRNQELVKAIDDFLKREQLEEVARLYAEQTALNQKGLMEAFHKKTISSFQEVKLLTDEEVYDFKKKLWHELRKKGYTQTELRT